MLLDIIRIIIIILRDEDIQSLHIFYDEMNPYFINTWFKRLTTYFLLFL